jgi:hypothetical protein
MIYVRCFKVPGFGGLVSRQKDVINGGKKRKGYELLLFVLINWV